MELEELTKEIHNNEMSYVESTENYDTNPLATWDVTIPAGNLNEFEIIEKLKGIAKKWAFQLEKGEETGYSHWQIRMSLTSKKRKFKLISLLKEFWPKCHVSPTSSENQKNMFYVMKEETRVRGPWSDKDVSTLKIPKYVKRPDQLWPWQQQMRKELLKQIEEENDRSINLLIDIKGGNGKSGLTETLIFFDGAVELISGGEMKDLMRMAYDCKDSKLYITDFPRALPKDKMKSYWAGLEALKKGHIYDDRFEFQERWLDWRPQVFVIINIEPNPEFLSSDRWKVWRLKGNGKEAVLVPSDFVRYEVEKNNIQIPLPRLPEKFQKPAGAVKIDSETQTIQKMVEKRERTILKPDLIVHEVGNQIINPVEPITNFLPRRRFRRF